MQNTLITNSLEKSYSYTEYRNHISKLLLDGLSTGETQSESLTHYSTLNEVRMKRLDKTIKLTPDVVEKLKAIKDNYVFLVISEGWCGDAAQLLPVMEKMASENDLIDLRIVLRDENSELMDGFLTNGGRAIPKLILVDAKDNTVLGNWGPRPEGGTKLIKDAKEKFGVINEETKTELQKWYLHDKGISAMQEITALLEKAQASK
ncbi:thioredoxin family protein [Flavobacterium arcticum]|uniref:Thioredoxin family protein n=1 Tax=Flavobacterium arcticum TaxID=1784713 RepID=A0A345HA65_9FLAO|nr:thioredoxin family protein [Flavobacterium arcticum]AXG73475.1 thioredoxin family protein [Flavobacterium arcticum]KAF2513264.1 thioredoxin family protein [Flavobacterium arcticum]